MSNRVKNRSLNRIDSHQHFWQLSRGDYSWLSPQLGPLFRDFLPAELVPHLQRANINKTILVQATDSEAETAFLLRLASQYEFIAGVVGWVEMEHPGAPGKIELLAKSQCFKGIRPMIQDITDVDWMLKPELTPAFDALMQNDLSFDALVLPEHLDNLLILLKRHPNLRTVIDHAGKPPIHRGELQPWQVKMAALAADTSAYCKLSGLVTEAGKRTNAPHLQPYVDCLLRNFGASRLMWGSDWPVVESVMPYPRWIELSQGLLEGMSPEDSEKIFGGTACQFYRITPN